MNGFDLLVVGNSVLDVFVVDDGDAEEAAETWTALSVRFLDRPPKIVLGGNGASTAYAAARSGARVALRTNLGDDAAGAILRDALSAAGVSIVSEPRAATAVNVVSVEASGGRRSRYFVGDPVPWVGDDPVSAAWTFAAGYGGATATDFEDLALLMESVRERGGKSAFDPGPWFRDVERERFRAVVGALDLVTATEEELAAWVGSESAEDIGRRVSGLGVPGVVVKRGALGACGIRAEQSFTVSVEPVEGAHSVGAGDTFNGVLLAALIAGRSLRDAVRLAVDRARLAVVSGGGVQGAFGPA